MPKGCCSEQRISVELSAKAGEGGLGIRRFKKYQSMSEKSMPKPGQYSLL